MMNVARYVTKPTNRPLARPQEIASARGKTNRKNEPSHLYQHIGIYHQNITSECDGEEEASRAGKKTEDDQTQDVDAMAMSWRLHYAHRADSRRSTGACMQNDAASFAKY